MLIERVSEASSAAVNQNLSECLVVVEAVAAEDEAGLANSPAALRAELSPHAQQFVEIAEYNAHQLAVYVLTALGSYQQLFVLSATTAKPFHPLIQQALQILLVDLTCNKPFYLVVVVLVKEVAVHIEPLPD